MPVSVGPDVQGEENLVFGYDLGDTENSFKGEPTTNLVDAFPDVSLPSGFHWTYEYSASISDSPVSGHFLSDKKWVKLTKTSATNGRVLFNANSFTAGNTYTITAYVYIDDNRNTSLAFNSDNGGYSQETADTPYNFSKIGTVQRIRGTWNQLQNGGSIYGLRGGTSNPIGSTIYMTGLQVEQNTHPTQLTAGTRSATQGLIDLTGNSEIDVTDVSFDSNAQMTFDGSSDKINLGSVLANSIGNQATVEMVFKSSRTNNTGAQILGWGVGSAYYSSVGIGSWFSSQPDESVHIALNAGGSGTNQPRFLGYARGGESKYNDQQYHHLVGKFATNDFQIWMDGELLSMEFLYGSQATVLEKVFAFDRTDIEIWIGARPYGGGSMYFAGDLPLLKVYNRALTASEIKANYNAIKGRFNI